MLQHQLFMRSKSLVEKFLSATELKSLAHVSVAFFQSSCPRSGVSTPISLVLIFILILNPLIPKLRESKILSTFLDTINVAAVALIIAVCIEMGIETLTDWRTIIIAVASLTIVFVFKKLNSAFIVLGGAIFGYLITLV